MQSRWVHFTKEELSCNGSCSRCSGTDNNMNPEFMNKIIKLRKLCNFPFKVISGYRCPDRNKEISKTGEPRTIQTPTIKRFDELRELSGIPKHRGSPFPHVPPEYRNN